MNNKVNIEKPTKHLIKALKESEADRKAGRFTTFTKVKDLIKHLIRSIKPSKFDASHKAHLNLLLNLMEEHITGKEVDTRKVEKDVEDIFV